MGRIGSSCKLYVFLIDTREWESVKHPHSCYAQTVAGTLEKHLNSGGGLERPCSPSESPSVLTLPMKAPEGIMAVLAVGPSTGCLGKSLSFCRNQQLVAPKEDTISERTEATQEKGCSAPLCCTGSH